LGKEVLYEVWVWLPLRNSTYCLETKSRWMELQSHLRSLMWMDENGEIGSGFLYLILIRLQYTSYDRKQATTLLCVLSLLRVLVVNINQSMFRNLTGYVNSTIHFPIKQVYGTSTCRIPSPHCFTKSAVVFCSFVPWCIPPSFRDLS